MNTAKKMLITGAVTTVVGAGAFTGIVSAQTPSAVDTQQSLAQKIAQKFNLNQDDVQKVIDDNRSAHDAERQQRLEDQLNQAVKDGKITSAQKDQILAKMQEMKTYADSIKDKSADDKRTLMKSKMDELKQWAQDNNLSQYLPMAGGQGHHGMHMMMRDGDNDMAVPDEGDNTPN